MGRKGDTPDSFTTFQYPALFALSLAIIDILFVAAMFRENTASGEKGEVPWATLCRVAHFAPYVCTNALLIHWI